MSQAEAWTILRLLQWTTEFLEKHGSACPRLDAELLLAKARGCQRIELYTAFEEVATDELRENFRALVRRRSEGMPVAYLLGHREFYSLDFRVSPAVLIPRPETEFVLIELLDAAKGHARSVPLQIADVGTGSGILGVCAAKHLISAQVTAIDISTDALEIAKQNADAHHVADRIEFLQSDLFGDVPANATFDFVVSNPPYVSDAEYEQLSADVKNFEPKGALVGGPSGTEIIAQLIVQAAHRLRAGGRLIIEISPMIESAVTQLIREHGSFAEPRTIKDLARLARVVSAVRV
ncbi:MAG: peptide chain release factor N(5)-glutamine methyltransferase [Pirellulaceae bacterium]|nr:peptide chain release factor N(5)-glutamine methyltransferase [Planctomycetales bacterium]